MYYHYGKWTLWGHNLSFFQRLSSFQRHKFDLKGERLCNTCSTYRGGWGRRLCGVTLDVVSTGMHRKGVETSGVWACRGGRGGGGRGGGQVGVAGV